MGFNIAPLKKLKIGMEYVPYDDMPALLHKGEAVLTKEQNEEYKNSKTKNNNNNKKELNSDKKSSTKFTIKITNFYNNRKQDVEALAEEIAFYQTRYKKARGTT